MKKRTITLRKILISDLIVLLLMGVFLYYVETRVTEERMQRNLRDRLANLQDVLEQADSDTYDTQYRYDQRMYSTAKGLAFLYDHEEEFEISFDLYTTFGVSDIQIGKEDEIIKDEEMFYYYQADTNDGKVVSVGVSKYEVKLILDSIYTEEKIINKMGNLTDMFLITNEDGSIRYYQEEGFTGKEVSALGITMDDLADGEAGWLKINNNWYYVCSADNEDLGMRISCGIASEKMTKNTNIAIIALFVVISLVFTSIICFIFFSKQEQKKNANNEQYSSANVTRKMTALALVGLLMIGVAAFFIQSLFCLSLSSLSMASDISEIKSSLNEASSDVELMTDFYNYYSLTHAKSVSYILSQHPECRNKEDLETLSDIYDFKYIMMFDQEGKEYLSDSSIIGFVISDDPEDQSYEFNVLKNGVEYVIQKPQPEELTGIVRQVIGVPTHDTKGEIDGFLLTVASPASLELLTDELSLETILDNTVATTGDDAFAIDIESGQFTYNTKEDLVGFKATDYGITEDKMRHNDVGSLTMDGIR